MTFEEWWREFWGNSWKDGAPVPDYGDSQGQIEQTKIACQEAWQSAYMQASSEMRGYIIDDIDYVEQDAILEVDGVNLYFQFEKEATLKEAIKYFKKEIGNALAWDEEDIEHRVNAAWQIGYDAGRGVD